MRLGESNVAASMHRLVVAGRPEVAHSTDSGERSGGRAMVMMEMATTSSNVGVRGCNATLGFSGAQQASWASERGTGASSSSSMAAADAPQRGKATGA